MLNNWMRVALIALCVIAAEGYAQRVDAAAILSGSVKFNSDTKLYTYSYTLDNTKGSKGVSEISILVARQGSSGSVSGAPWPVPFASPNGWNFDASTGGVESDLGSNYLWRGYLPVGSVLSGFSFSVSLAPSKSSPKNYFLYGWNIDASGHAIDGGVIELGSIAAPDTAPADLPPPSTSSSKTPTSSLPASGRGPAYSGDTKRGSAYPNPGKITLPGQPQH
jgi:hypothetical protein